MTCYPYGRDRNLPVIVWIRGTKVNSYYTASILGGDEFCVILTRNVDRIDQLNAAFACRLQNNRAQLPWLPDVSTGYAVFDTSEEELGSAVERADAAMYRVKNEKKGSGKILNIKFLLAQSLFGRKPGLRSVTGQRPPLCGGLAGFFFEHPAQVVGP